VKCIKILVGKTEWKNPGGRSVCRSEDSIKMDSKERERERVCVCVCV
jgi:hypothetical protein